jgi:adenylosuccinate synthase
MATAYQVVGLGFGDESKGATVDKLCRSLPVDLIVRHNGGSQAAHNVVTPEGVHHTFAQFGSGMLANNRVRSHLSRFMLVDPITMMNEAKALVNKTADPWVRTTVDARCVIITPWHKQLNRLREDARGEGRHGSCGMGVGVARELHLEYGDDSVVLARDVAGDPDQLYFKLCSIEEIVGDKWSKFRSQCGVRPRLEEYLIDKDDLMSIYRCWPAKIVDGLEPVETMVFEGAQGVLLDETHGLGAPDHVTWTDTTFKNADTLCDEMGVDNRFRIGCLRSYFTRHGAGPFPTEDATLDLPEPHNGTGEYQGAFRVGHFDFSLMDKALKIVGGVDYLAISHLDILPKVMGPTPEEDFLDFIQMTTDTEIGIQAYGPTADDRTVHGTLAGLMA